MANPAGFKPGQKVYMSDSRTPPLVVIRHDQGAGIVTCLWHTEQAMGQVEIPESILEGDDDQDEDGDRS